MTVYGFHASHEQVHPAQLLEAVQLAEQVGFAAAMCSDLSYAAFDEVHLHHVGQEQREFLEVLGEKVLPQLDVTARGAA